MNANKLADEIKTMLADSESYYGNAEGYLIKAEALLRQQQAKIEALKQVLQSIANEHVELSHDKIKWQCDDHIRWAKEALK